MLISVMVFPGVVSGTLAQGVCRTCKLCRINYGNLVGTINDNIEIKRLYAQIVSPSDVFDDVDSICFDFNSTIVTNTREENQALLVVTVTNKDKSTEKRVYIETELRKGGFSSVGPTYPGFQSDTAGVVSLFDFTIGHPCESVYVFKRCPQIFEEADCLDEDEFPVFILSTKVKEDDQGCLVQAMEKGRAAVGSLDYLELPRTVVKPCPSGSVVGGSVGEVTSFEINLPKLLSIKF